MIRPVVARAKDLKAMGYTPEQIASSLVQEGNNFDLVEAAIAATFDKYLSQEKPPRNYDDIRHIVQATLLINNPQEIVHVLTSQTQFGSIMPASDADYFELEQTIAYVAKSRSESVLGEIHETLRFYLDEMIKITRNAASSNEVFDTVNRREEYIIDKWFEWFGIWPPKTQQSLHTNASQPMLIEEYEDGEYTLCPKFKTEINVDNVCRSSKCPFYQEVMTANGIVKACKFKKY